MSFVSPLWLLALLAVPLVLLARWYWRGRARRFALRFSAVPSLIEASDASRRSWYRYLAPLALLAAIAALAVALARPQVTHRVPINGAELMLVLDHSGSMAATDVAPTRIQAAIAAANTFIGELPGGAKVGAIGFGTTPDAVQQPVADHSAARDLLDSQEPDGSTDTADALQLALELLHGNVRNHPPAAIVLLSDGAANAGPSPVTVAAVAKQEHIPIYTVALGTPGGTLPESVGPYTENFPVPPDPQLMAAIANTSGGRSFDAKTASELSSVYHELGFKLSSIKRERDITVWVLLLAALLLIVAVVGSVRRTVVLR